ncbi:MAG: hypothetical protein ACR2O0_04945, partial [Rhizobiaceae bacterium]
MRNPLLSAFSAGILLFVLAFSAHASEKQFYENIQGQWAGPGSIVAGKYKGTKFTCRFQGLSPEKLTGMSIDGNCRVGLFSQIMNANFKRSAKGYTGKFLDGEAGEGMDIVGGRYTRSKLVVDIKRKDLTGVMVAKLHEEDKLNITISVRVRSRLVPVIGMSLKRTGPALDST